MTRLMILRHAKSSWSDPNLDDHERPLNARGRRAAEALGHWMRDHALFPDHILCSSAARTQETAARLDLACPVTVSPALYLADADRIWRILATVDASDVMIIGHNPGIADFAQACLTKFPSHSRFHDYPTGALTVVAFDKYAWHSGRQGNGKCDLFVTPKDITHSQVTEFKS